MTDRPLPSSDSPMPSADSPLVPDYTGAVLGALLPAVAAALGVPTAAAARPALALPESEKVCVVLIDGLGRLLLEEFAADAPYLSGLASAVDEMRCGAPATTATSMASFGTGLPPGTHGLLGYEVLDPDTGVLHNALTWPPGVDPLRWQPHPTVFESLAAAGVSVTRIGDPRFEGSGLTVAAHRGGRFVGEHRLHGRVNAAVSALAEPGRALTYLYWGDVDHAGHVHGCRSSQWRRALRRTDRGLARLARNAPKGTLLLVTADHGMVDVPAAGRVDLGLRADLAEGVRILGGEPRFAQAYCEPGAAAGVAARWTTEFENRAWVRTRDEAVREGWFGAVAAANLPRIGDVLVAARDRFAVVDSRTASPHALQLIGQHGSFTDAEQLVPLLLDQR